MTPARASWRFVNREGELEMAQREVSSLLAIHGVDARAVYAGELVLEEWLTNVWRHGHSGESGAPVDLEVDVEPHAVRMHFVDTGKPFDPVSAPEPQWPGSLAEAKPGGLGVWMIHRFASEVVHERVDGHNHLRVLIARE